MFPFENTPVGESSLLTSEPQSHRLAIALLVFLFGLAGAGAAVAYYYPGETRIAMSRIQAKVTGFINPAHERAVSDLEPAAIGDPPASNQGFADTLPSAPPAADVTGRADVSSVRPGGGAAASSSPAGAPSSVEPSSPKPAASANTAAASQAQLDLARSYLSAGSTADQKAEAVQLLWLATEKGNVEAEIQLADLYARGENVPKNCAQARILLKVAAAANPGLAQPKLAEFDSSGCSN